MGESNWVIYGANGYTGRLAAQMAVQRGMRPILAGRDAGAVGALAQELRLPARSAALDEPAALDRVLAGCTAVLHCAGPFVRTSKPLADACLRNGVHYLDITGEISVFEGLAARYDEARRAGVMLLPGVGFDVVPSDCLAAHLNRRLPDATHLVLGIRSTGGISRGTAMTMLESIERGEGGMVRRDGELVRVPAAAKTREIDFGNGARLAVSMPWGDVSTAYHSTGIPNIEVYMSFPKATIYTLQIGARLGWLLRAPGVLAFLKRQVQAGAPGPNSTQRARGHSLLWGMVQNDQGGSAASLLWGPEGYSLTAQAALLIMSKVLEGEVRPGFQTPSSAYGADLILQIPGVQRADL